MGLIVGTAFILFIMVAFAGTAQETVVRSPVVTTENIEVVSDFPDFQRKTSTEETDTYYFSISTILTKSEPINQYIQMWTEKERDQFLAFVEKNKRNFHEEHLAKLHITVHLNAVTDDLHTLTFNVKNKKTEPRDGIKIFNLDLTENKILSLIDVFHLEDSNLVGFCSIIKEYIPDASSQGERLEELFKRPDQINWQINQNVFTLFLKDHDPFIKVEVPVERLRPYLTENMMTRLKLAPPEELESTLDPNGKYIALTFDDGPSPAVTPRILETLKQHQAKATFFMIGNRVQYYPELAKQVAEEGNEIGNHSGSHANLSQLSEAQIWQEIVGTNQIIEGVIGHSPVCFRPPYGVYNPLVEKVASENNAQIILWSVDSLDWQERNAEGVNKIVQETIFPGSIVLLHDIHPSTADALPTLMTELENQGYQFVTVSELLTLQGVSGIGPYYGVSN